MVLVDGQHILLPGDVQVLEALPLFGDVHRDAVQLQPLQHLLQLVAAELVQGQGDVGVLLFELRDDGKDGKGPADAGDPHPEPPPVHPGDVVQLGPHVGLDGENLLDVLQVALPGVGEHHAVVDPLKQGGAQLPLLPLEEAGQGGLRHPQLYRRPGQGPLPGDGGDILIFTVQHNFSLQSVK